MISVGLTSACSPTPLARPVSGQNWLCDAARIEADLGKVAARLTRRALGTFRKEEKDKGLAFRLDARKGKTERRLLGPEQQRWQEIKLPVQIVPYFR
jgi:hypothetical protein